MLGFWWWCCGDDGDGNGVVLGPGVGSCWCNGRDCIVVVVVVVLWYQW